MALKTRKPTGRAGWPRILLEGTDKSGKSWAAAVLTASPKVGRSAVLILGEDESRWDEYGKIPGTRFEIALHDGTWKSIMTAAEEAREEAAQALAGGEAPFVFIIDTMTAVWEGLKDWATFRARNSKKNRKILEEDPDAEIDVTSNYWNDARARHRQLMRVLLTFPGIVVLVARGSEVALFQNGQPVAGRTTWSVEGEKNLPFDVSVHVRLSREARPLLVSASGVHCQIRPGIDPPRRLPDDWSLESVIFGMLKLDSSTARAGAFVTMRPDALTPEQIRDEAADPWTAVARIRELYTLAVQSRYGDMTMAGENGQEEPLLTMLGRIGAARSKARQALDDGDPWLVAIEGIADADDAERVRAEMTGSFAGVPAADPRFTGLREAFAGRVRQISAPAAARPGDYPAVRPSSEAEWVPAFLARLAETSDDGGLGERREEVNRALAGKVIPARTASELHTAVNERAAAVRGARQEMAA